MTFEYIDSNMKTREIIIMVLFIVAVCVISLIPFSNSEIVHDVNQTVNLETFKGNTSANIGGNLTAGNTSVTTVPIVTTAVPTFPDTILSNADFISAVINALSKPADPSNDKLAIYKIQGLISPLKKQNAATMMGEIGNPNNLTDPRLFLHYMNWFGSVCAIDTDTCVGLC
jgi:hypothetical protein